jgi:cytochrome c-type biogenesis protein CcmE
VARNGSPARLVIALSIAAVLAVFLLYTSIAGGGTPSIAPSELRGRTDEVSLAGRVIGPVTGDAHAGGMRFRLRDVEGTATVRVVYTGSVPDLFRPGRDIAVTGRLRNGTFVTSPGSMITKCPSKYSAKKQ